MSRNASKLYSKKNIDIDKLKSELLKYYDSRGAEYPAEHNVGHEYKAKESLLNYYKNLDPTNSFNPGIGQSSKTRTGYSIAIINMYIYFKIIFLCKKI